LHARPVAGHDRTQRQRWSTHHDLRASHLFLHSGQAAGIRPTGFWTVLVGDGNNDLHYLLGWESLAEREQKWTAFQADPEWHKARDDSEKDGLLIANIKSALLRPTPFSAIR
jgi:hypothetical protein